MTKCIYNARRWLATFCIASLTACTAYDNSQSPPKTATSGATEIQVATGDVSAEDSIVKNSDSEATANTAVAPAGEKKAADSKIKVSLINHQQLMEAIEKHQGKIVVLDVWSNSCIPCLREFPHLVELSRRWPALVRCVSLNVDYIGLKNKPPESYTAKVESFVVAQKAEFENFQATETDETIFAKFQLESIPGILIFDRDGRLHAKFTDANAGGDGLTYQSDVLPVIEKLLSKQ